MTRMAAKSQMWKSASAKGPNTPPGTAVRPLPHRACQCPLTLQQLLLLVQLSNGLLQCCHLLLRLPYGRMRRCFKACCAGAGAASGC